LADASRSLYFSGGIYRKRPALVATQTAPFGPTAIS
jgi:hypothetical protein